jgi:transposase
MRRRSPRRCSARPWKFVATKTADQLDLQALHRVRERLVGQRTGIINQIRAFLLERGIAVRQGLRKRDKTGATANLDGPLRAARLHSQAGTKERPQGTNKGTARSEELSMT